MSQWPGEAEAVGLIACGAMAWTTRGALRVTAVVKATFNLVHGAQMTPCAPLALTIKDLHQEKNPAKSLASSSDLAPYLPRADVTFIGHAYAPAGRTVPASSARLAVFRGRPLFDKTLHVFGDRATAGGPPRPFQRMPLTYERAPRGPGNDNPVGMLASNGWLPNIVDPRTPDLPAGFGPVSRYWPPRRKLLGQAARSAVEGAIADIPEGFAWEYFQSAPRDQQTEFLRGDEWLVLDGLHPTLPRLQTQLPGARGAAMVHTQGPGGYGPGYQVALVADTLAIDGDHLTASIVWRASFPVRDLATLATLKILGGVALPGAPIAWPAARAIPPREPPRDDESATADFDPTRTGSLSRTADIGAAQRPSTPFHSVAGGTGKKDLARTVTAIGEAPRVVAPFPLAPQGDPGAHAKAANLPGAPWAAPAVPAPKAAFDEESTRFITLSTPADAPPSKRAAPDPEESTRAFDIASIRGGDLAKALPFVAPPAEGALPPHPQDGDEPEMSTVAIRITPRHPKRDAAAPQDEDATRAIDIAALRGAEREPALPFVAARAEPPASVVAPPPMVSAPADALLPTATPPAPNAPLPPPPLASPPAPVAPPSEVEPPPPAPAKVEAPAIAAPEVESEPASALRTTVVTRLKAREPLHDLSLAGADLREVDFSGAQLSRINLKGATLARCRFEGARLVDAQLGDADLTEANLGGADLSQADLGRAQLARARFDGATLVEAKLNGAQGPSASFVGAKATRATFARGQWDGSSFERAELTGADFTAASLAAARFEGATLLDACLTDARGAGATFDDARLSQANAPGATFPGASFKRADAAGSVWAKAALDEASFAGAKLEAANFTRASCTKTSFAGADAGGANLERLSGDGADLREARLDGADLRQARLHDASFDGASLRNLVASKADLAGSRFLRANLEGASLRGAKLGGALLAHARLDGADLRDADLTGANVFGASRKTAKLSASARGLLEIDPEEPGSKG